MAESKFTYEIISKEKKTIRIKQAVSVTEEVVIPEKVVYYKLSRLTSMATTSC